ncbi:MAG TPA: hypothetical protein VIV15_16715, partial [Anaerolineales bacterium]
LQKNQSCIYLEIENDIYAHFPGLLTPSKALIYEVLNSYATKDAALWRLRPEDTSANRRAELKKISELLEALGTRLDYSVEKEARALLWKDGQTTVHVLYPIASALIGRVLNENRHPPENCILVIPGGRAALALYKEQRDPVLKERMKEWSILKFRLARTLLDIPVLTRETFEEQIASDPVEKTEGQMMMF